MNMNGFLKLFIDDLTAEICSLYYDEESDIDEDEIRLEPEEYPGIVIEVDRLMNHINVYRVFSYYDYNKREREAGVLEEIEQEIMRYYEQKDFEKALSRRYKSEVWADDYWGCPCVDVLVGWRNIKCDIRIVKDFIEIYSTFDLLQGNSGLPETRKFRLERLLGGRTVNSGFQICERADINYTPLENNCIFYIGKEYILLKNQSETAAIQKCHYDLLMEILEDVEYFSDYYVEILSNVIRFVTCSYTIDIARIDDRSAINTETVYFDLSLQNFLLFVTGENLERLEATIGENNAQTKDLYKFFLPHLYTEGQTDWLHIKNALKYSLAYKDKEWIFDEKKAEKGDRELLELCRIYGNRDDGTCVRIAIFDRDGSIELKKIEDAEKGFKEWGNRMYSFALPVPKHREKTPNVSIEHYYTDEEIFHEYEIGGVVRRLYMGFEFDDIGRSISLRKICGTPKKCGDGSIAILDSGVYDIDSDSKTDYALSKARFTEKICGATLSDDAIQAFEGLFAKIMKVIKHDEEKHGKGRQMMISK